jgi:hypothetical protein
MNSRSLSEFTPEQHLPSLFGEGDPLPEGIVGSRILAFGAAPDSTSVEGGLVIDYLPEGENVPVRVVLYFTDLGMGVELMGHLLYA